jgi:hypothetical protein
LQADAVKQFWHPLGILPTGPAQAAEPAAEQAVSVAEEVVQVVSEHFGLDFPTAGRAFASLRSQVQPPLARRVKKALQVRTVAAHLARADFGLLADLRQALAGPGAGAPVAKEPEEQVSQITASGLQARVTRSARGSTCSRGRSSQFARRRARV